MKLRSPVAIATLFFSSLLVSCGDDHVAVPPSADGEASTEHAESEAPKPKGAERHFARRLDADGTIPEDAIGRMIAQRDATIAARPLSATDPLSNWRWRGPGNVGGRVRAILIHPTQTNTMWVGSAAGGVWKTTNGGSSWFGLDGLPAFLGVSCMVMDPRNADRIYAGTGEGGFFDTLQGSSNLAVPNGAGIWRTDNGGTTWTRLASTTGQDWLAVNRLAISPSNSNVMLAGTATGIFRTTNGGTSWSKASSAATLDLDFHPSDGSRAVAGSRDGYAQYSTNGGATWSRASGIGLSQRVEIAYARSAPNTVFATASTSSQRITIYRSTDGGRSFSRRTTSTIRTYSRYNNALWVDPTDPNHIIFGAVNLYKSSNGGASFGLAGSSSQSVGASLYYDMHVVVEHPNYNGTSNQTVFNGDDGGVHRALNAKSSRPSWRHLNNNLGINQFYGAAISPDGSRIVGGLQDQGSLLYTGSANGWRKVLSGDGSMAQWDPTNPNVCYAQIYWTRVYRSTNSGSRFSSIGTSRSIRDPGSNFIPPILLDPNNSNSLYFAGAGLWRTNNARTSSSPSWSRVKAPLNCPSQARGGDEAAHFAKDPACNISTMAVAKSDSNVMYVGHNHGELYRSTNARSASPTWQRVNAAMMPKRWISRIMIDPADARRVYVAFMGFHPDNLWRSDDGGNSWLRITGSGTSALPSAPIPGLAVHPNIPGVLFAGTDAGVYWSTDDGRSWDTSAAATRTSGVEELAWQDADTLMIVTHGRGIFMADVLRVGGARPVGRGCGTTRVPAFSASSPCIGASQVYAVRSAPASAPLVLLLAAGAPSPLTLGGGCVTQPALASLIVSPVGATNASGAWNANVPVPNNVVLIGGRLTSQMISISGSGPLLGFGELSNGVEMRIGR